MVLKKDLIAENKELKEDLEKYRKYAIGTENAKLKPCVSSQCYDCKFAIVSYGLSGPRLFGCMKDCVCADYMQLRSER